LDGPPELGSEIRPLRGVVSRYHKFRPLTGIGLKKFFQFLTEYRWIDGLGSLTLISLPVL